jgi:ADP-ribose pyrophosphatase
MKEDKSLKNWSILRSEEGPDILLFRVRYDWVENPRNSMQFKRVVLECPDWVNIIAVTPEKNVILVHQYRFGTRTITTEIPSGLVDPGETHAMTAQRELLEETGYASEEWKYLGAVQPNPAFQNNLCHHWFAQNVRKIQEPSLDAGEDIRVSFCDISDIQKKISDGEISHVLALSAFSRFQDLWRADLFQDV